MSIDHGKVLALADRVDDVCTRMTSKDGFLSPESDPRRLLWQIGDELREAAAAIAKLAESIDMVTAEHIGGCPFTGTPNSISSCACAWWLAHDAAQPAEAVDGREPVVWRVPTKYGIGYSFASEEVMRELCGPAEAVEPCRCVDCGGDMPGHSTDCAWMKELHNDAVHGAVAWLRPDVLYPDGRFQTLSGDAVDTPATRLALSFAKDIFRHANQAGVCALEFAQRIHDAYPHPQAAPAQEIEAEPASCVEADGCPTEMAVLQRFWRQQRAAPAQGDGEMAKIGRLIETQDNRITEAPIFIVQQKRQHVSDADYDNDGIVWVNDDNQEAGSEDHARLEAAFLSNFNEEPKGWRRLAVRTEWEFVTACFTEQGCKDYLARDGHNLKEPRIYAAGSYRNEEWRSVRKFLMSLAAAPSQEGES